MRERLNKWLGIITLVCCTTVLGEVSSQYDTEALLKQARTSFQSSTGYEDGCNLLEQYIREQQDKFPEGYTFGFDAAKVAMENLGSQQAVEIIEKLSLRFKSDKDKPIQEGLNASLLEAYANAQQWTNAMKVMKQLYDTERTNFLINMSVFSFGNNLVINGQTNEAKEVLTSYFCTTNKNIDGVAPNAFWMEQAANLAFQLKEKEIGFQLLDNIERNYPEYCKDNQIHHIIMRINALREINENKEIAKWVALAYQLKQEGYTVSDVDKDVFENDLKAYHSAGWLNEENQANEEQVYTPPTPPRHPYRVVFFSAFIAFLLTPPIIFILLYIRKSKLK
ncbi:MAG: hypothetical protein EOM12_08250 [Verrucomicrobiae bacterium]|nr:hypothetical protein [Verrucomicrobiae bacterium]